VSETSRAHCGSRPEAQRLSLGKYLSIKRLSAVASPARTRSSSNCVAVSD
jgi:hypothetical protein